MSEDKVIICRNCGCENKAGSSFCNECGAKLSGVNIDTKRPLKETALENSGHQHNPKKRNKKNKSSSGKNKPERKVLSKGKLFYLVIALALIGLFNLFSAGVFDLPVYVGPPVQNNTADLHRGVDLENLHEINNLSQIVENNPGDYESLLKLAHLRNDSGFYTEAIKDYRAYLKLCPNEPDVMVDMGVCYYQLDDFENAVSVMKQALEINPGHQIAHFNIGIVSFAANKKDEAVSWWKKAIKIDPNTNIAKKAEELINSHQ